MYKFKHLVNCCNP